MKSGNLNFLEPSGPLQACNGTDLPFTFYQVQISLLRRLRKSWAQLMDSGEKHYNLTGFRFIVSLIKGRVSQRSPASRDLTVVSGTQRKGYRVIRPWTKRLSTFVVYTLAFWLFLALMMTDRFPLIFCTSLQQNTTNITTAVTSPFSLSLQSGCPCILIDHSPIVVFNIAVSVVIGISNFRPKNDVLHMNTRTRLPFRGILSCV